MSPIFQPDKNVRATTRIFERGEYEVEIAAVSGIGYTKDNGDEVAGARYRLTMRGRLQNDGSLDDEYAGEDVTPFRAYVHSEGAIPFTKRFLMAAMGYGRNDESDFDDEWWTEADLTIEFDEEDVTLGEGWEDPVGNVLRVTLDKEEYEGQEQQTHATFAPVS